MSSFQIHPIDPAIVEDAARRLAVGDPSVAERVVDSPTGYPCRLSLQEAPVGARVLLFRHRPFRGRSPYAEEGPVFARRGVEPAKLEQGEVPAYVLPRPLVVVRRYDEDEAISGAEVVSGADCAAALSRAFDLDDTAFVHVRSAGYGCFLFRAERA
jgi:hypothetical protein